MNESQRRVAELEAALRDLRVDLHAARIREEIALTLPQLLRRSRRVKKAAPGKRRRPALGTVIQRSAQRASGSVECAPPC